MVRFVKVTTVLFIFLLPLTVAAEDLSLFADHTAENIFTKKEAPDLPRFDFTKVNQKVPGDAKGKSDKDLTPQEKIIQEFGDPSLPQPVSAVESAPDSYKAMLAAINIGDRELAYRYAKKHVRYMEDLNKVAREATALQGVAMKAEGMLADNSWASEAYMSEYQYLLDIEEEATEGQDSTEEKGKVKEEAIALIQEAKADKTAKTDLFADSVEEQKKTSVVDSQRARKELTGKLPKIPVGKLDIFFFFKPTDQDSIDQARELQIFFNNLNEDDVNLIGFSIEGPNATAFRNFHKDSKSNFTLAGGMKLSEELNIKNVPVIMFVNPVNADFYMLKEQVSAAYLSEALKIIRRIK